MLSDRAEIVVLTILLGLVGIIVLGFLLFVGLFGIGVTHQSSGSGGVVYVGTSCPPPPGAAASAGCDGD
jgi:hypothetical protein